MSGGPFSLFPALSRRQWLQHTSVAKVMLFPPSPFTRAPQSYDGGPLAVAWVTGCGELPGAVRWWVELQVHVQEHCACVWIGLCAICRFWAHVC